MKKYISSLAAVVVTVGLAAISIAQAQEVPEASASNGSEIAPTTVVIPAQSFGGLDLSILTNHASLVSYALKNVQSTQVRIYSGSRVDNGSDVTQTIPYTNTVKSIDDIMQTIFANQYWMLHVADIQDSITMQIELDDYPDRSTGKDSPLITGGTGGQPQQNQYGQWDWKYSLSLQLSQQIKIHVAGLQLAGAKLIARDQYGQPYPVDMTTDSDGFYFNTQFAGNGTLVLSGWVPMTNQPGWWQWTQSAISLKDGSPVALTWVDAQVILAGSGDVSLFKNTADLTTLIYDWNGYGNVPMGEAVFTQATTNVLLNTYTMSGQFATSYDVENVATHVKKSYVVPDGATSVTTGTNVMKGTYNVVPQGITLTPWGIPSYGPKG